jgi:hypothetical protein
VLLFSEYQDIKLKKSHTAGNVFLPKGLKGFVLETHGDEACEVEFPNTHHGILQRAVCLVRDQKLGH